MWYKFTTFNQEARYGWTEDRNVAEAALEWLNKGREVGVYGMTELGEDVEYAAEGDTVKLADRNDHLFTAYTRPEDFAESE